MTEKVRIIATTGVDAHRVLITKETLISSVEGINGDRAIKSIVDHDLFCMPFGKVMDGWVEAHEDRHFLLARVFYEDEVKLSVHPKTGTQLALFEFSEYSKPFVREFQNGPIEETRVNVDIANFDDWQKYSEFENDVGYIDERIACSSGLGRKSAIPEPFIQFVLSNPVATTVLAVVGRWILVRAGKFITQTTDDTLRKIGDDLSDELSTKVRAVLNSYKRRQSKDVRPVVIQIIVQGDVELNLLTRTEHDSELQDLDLKQLRAEIEKYKDLLQEADSITFGREGNGDWEFQHMTTKSGKVIGTLSCYERTMKLLAEVWSGKDSDENNDLQKK